MYFRRKNWNLKIKKKEKFFNNICKFFPKNLNLLIKRFISLYYSNNNKIQKLNKKFRNKNIHTDILSFPFQKNSKNLKELYLGDIIISFNHMNKPKNLNNTEFKKKVIKIFIHGFLHLLGFNHIKEKDYQKMFHEEQKIFNSVKKIIN